MPPLADESHCWNHSPARAADRARARQRGGKAKGYPPGEPRGPVSLRKAEDIQAELERVIEDTWSHAPGPTRSRTLGYLLGLTLTALTPAGIEERLLALEAQINTGPRRVA
jgi:hypothetical protein